MQYLFLVIHVENRCYDCLGHFLTHGSGEAVVRLHIVKPPQFFLCSNIKILAFFIPA
ncbi:hypothetical protein QJS04_geneDACA012642 [Acorus gramineus]|uniref:Uncharacterized protein n=1 Tax=Acorus gramineus TaxID=55184 RepID=A0AAV9B5B7_ACOGR|nr:hypothetical protein QJS04_geneDACA012642 [Acorus gramineus]